MAPSLLLAAPPPTSDTDPLNADCTKRNVALPPPFGGVIATHPATPRPGPSSTTTTPSPTTRSESECDTYDASRTNRTLSAYRQWTGTPIRAIVPFPRRTLHGSDGAMDATRSVNLNVPVSTVVVGPPCLTRSAHFWDGADTDCGAENEEEEEEEEEEGSDEDCHVAISASRYCSYESITAAKGHSAWSFEELRVECYAQSLVARGTKPPPVVRSSLAIPPAFVPRFVLRS